MGYRSDVAAVVYSDASGDTAQKYAALKMFMSTKFKDTYDEFYRDFTWNDKCQRLEFRCNDVKWYDGFPHIDNFMSMLDMLQDMGYDYEFLRVGEDHDDVVHSGDGSDCVLNVQRSIQWDWE